MSDYINPWLSLRLSEPESCVADGGIHAAKSYDEREAERIALAKVEAAHARNAKKNALEPTKAPKTTRAEQALKKQAAMLLPEKTCLQCGQSKLKALFAKHMHSIDGYTSSCKECLREMQKERDIKNPEKYALTQKKRLQDRSAARLAVRMKKKAAKNALKAKQDKLTASWTSVSYFSIAKPAPVKWAGEKASFSTKAAI